MLTHKFKPVCKRLAGFVLLAAMLVYVSGAALIVHHEIEHSGAVDAKIVKTICNDAHPHPTSDAPADTTPRSDEPCSLCDMLAGVARAGLIDNTGSVWFVLSVSFDAIDYESATVNRLLSPDISRRGPPLSA